MRNLCIVHNYIDLINVDLDDNDAKKYIVNLCVTEKNIFIYNSRLRLETGKEFQLGHIIGKIWFYSFLSLEDIRTLLYSDIKYK